MSHAPLRTLPVTSPPAPYETISSYLARLERLNHLQRDALLSTLATVPSSQWRLRGNPASAIGTERLSVVAGYPITTLRQAMPQLRSPEPDPSLFQQTTRPACLRCVRRDGGEIRCRFPMRHYLCIKHKTWVGCRTRGWTQEWEESTMLDVSGLPDVVRAQQRHRRLADRYGEQAMAQALRQAERCLDHWTEQRFIDGAQFRRLNVLLTAGWDHIDRLSPAYVISYYPEMVDLAAVLASPGWRKLAADPTTRPRFLAEIARQRDWPKHDLPYPEPRRGPLREWILDLEEEAGYSTRIRFTRTSLSLMDQRI